MLQHVLQPALLLPQALLHGTTLLHLAMQLLHRARQLAGALTHLLLEPLLQLQQFGFDLLALGEVGKDGDHVGGHGAALAQSHAELDPAQAAVGADHPLLQPVVLPLPREQGGEQGQLARQILGVGHGVPGSRQHLLFAVAEQSLQPRVGPQPASLNRREGHAHRRLVEGEGEQVLLVFQHLVEAAYLMAPFQIVQGVLHQAAEVVEVATGLLVEVARCMIHQTEGAEHHAVQRPQRPAGIEDHVGLARHQRVVGKARVESGILHLHDVGAQDGVATEGVLPADLAQGDPGAGEKPLPVHVGQRDHGDGQREMAGDEPGQAIQLVDGLAVKQAQDAEPFQSALFIQRKRGGNHTALLLVALPGLYTRR